MEFSIIDFIFFLNPSLNHSLTNTGSKKRKDIYKLARKHKKLGFRPNLMHISILHIGKIYMNAKFLSEMSVYDSQYETHVGKTLKNIKTREF